MATGTQVGADRPARLTGLAGVAYRGLLGGILAALAYVTVLAAYLATTTTEVLDPMQATYPLVWFAVASASLAAAFGISAPDRRGSPGGLRERLPQFVGLGYVVLLAGISGTLSVGPTGFGLDVASGLPGWGPIVLADLLAVTLVIVPFQVVGYVALGALLARALAVSTGSLFAGTLGLFSCAGCVLPVVAAGASALGVPLFADGVPVIVSTVAFSATAVALVALAVRGGRRDGTCRDGSCLR